MITFMAVIFAVVLLAGLFFLFRLMERSLERGRAEARDGMQTVMNDLQVRLGTFQSATESRLENIRSEVDKKLSETIAKNFQSFDAVSKRLEELHQVTGQVVTLSQGVRDLGKILESPKLRGAMGEFQLGEMLRQILPEDVYEEQFAIDGKGKETVDAVIKLKEGFLCIDSKFPLNNARALLEDNLTEDETKNFRKAFANDVRNMAESISKKYIIPDKTLDFALMFIPAESVFYELMRNQELHQDCLKRHVMPVSPNSFYAYLQSIAVGFRGLKIQAEAKKIETAILRLRVDFQKFQGDFSKVGKHLKDAQTQYNNVEDRVERFGQVIDRLGLEADSTVKAPLAASSESQTSLKIQ